MSDKVKRTDVNTLGEFGLIDHLTKTNEAKHPSTLLGVGDDAAVLDYGGKPIVVSTDMLLEGIHFDLMYCPLKHLGYKSVAVNISDICAMNALPRQITVSIAISNRFSVEALDQLYEGIYTACRNYDVDLVGGDTNSNLKGLVISITALGTNQKEKLTYRSGAKPGDILCVTGDLGAAYLGLQILEREKQLWQSNPAIQPDLEDQAYLIGRQLKPEARTDMVKLFDKAGLIPTSMIDISDGLASEVLHICKASGTGALVEEAKVPLKDEAQLMALKFKLDPITCALSGGEDYELLFTADPKDLPIIRTMPGIFIIGEMTDANQGVNLQTVNGNIHEITAQGWKHVG
ncbi:MAG: thiamine-phosphate kinase [Saprospirales bacterium]|nr:MAG: thiamine-phosphate kinase [Saprospirales bacterium]